jgi:very-short-patch-repair endonuclease
VGAFGSHIHSKGAHPPLDTQIATLAGRQHGVVALTQLKAMGLSADAVKHRLRCRRLHRVHRGVYAVGHPALTREGRWLAAVLACGPPAVLSHRSAGALWGIRPSAAAAIDVTVPTRGGRRRREGIVVHRTTRLGEEEVTASLGIPVTTLARTLLDLAAVLPRRGLEKAIDESERLGLFDLTPLRAAFQAHPGRHAVAAVLKNRAEPIFTRSDLEERLLELCERHGVPQPKVNTHVGEFEVDFLWPEARLIVETDGRASHATHAAFESDRARDAELTVAGYRVVRFTHRQVERDAERVAALLAKLAG